MNPVVNFWQLLNIFADLTYIDSNVNFIEAYTYTEKINFTFRSKN